MRTEDFLEVWCNTELRQYVVNIARKFTYNKKHQEELFVKGWVAISEKPREKTVEYYVAHAYHIMHEHYVYYLRARRGWPSHDPGVRRARRRLRKVAQ